MTIFKSVGHDIRTRITSLTKDITLFLSAAIQLRLYLQRSAFLRPHSVSLKTRLLESTAVSENFMKHNKPRRIWGSHSGGYVEHVASIFRRHVPQKILSTFNGQSGVTFQQRSWLRHYATSRKVGGSIPEVIRVVNWSNPFSRTMALGFTQPLNRNEYQKSSWG
jgi:hypothetical protein